MRSPKAFLVAMTVASSGVLAQPAASPNAELIRLSAESALLDARVKIAEKRAKLAELERAASGAPSSGTGTWNGASETLPTVIAIEGIDGRLRATMQIAGTRQVAAKGDKVFGGWTVSEVRENAVYLEKGSRRERLSFGDQDSRSAAAAGLPLTGPFSPAPLGLPGLPGGPASAHGR